MSVESLQEIEQYIKDNAESPEVSAFVSQFKQSLDADNVKSYLDSDVGRPLLQSLKDKAEQDAVALYKERHLQKDIDAKLLELNPPKTEAEKELIQLRQDMERIKTDQLRKEMKLSTIEKFSEDETLTKYAPALANLALGSTAEETEAKTDAIKALLGQVISETVAGRIAATAHKPTPGQANGPGKSDIQAQYEAAVLAHSENGSPENLRRMMGYRRQLKELSQE